MTVEDGDGEPKPATIVSVAVIQTLQWCLRFHTRLDEAESALDLAIGVQYSPLTESIAQSLHDLLEYQPAYHWPPGSEDKVHQVLAAMRERPHDSPSMPPRR